MHKLGFTFCVTLLLAGCAAAGQKESAEAANFCVAVKSQFAPVLGTKISMGNVADTTPAMLANQSFPTPEEAKALNDMSIALAPCRQRITTVIQRYDPATYTAMQTYQIQQQIITGDLIAKKISFGEANKRFLGAYLDASAQGQRQEAIAQEQRQRAYANWLAAMRATQGATCNTYASANYATTNCH